MHTVVSPFFMTITYWLHMVATVVWIGGLTAVSLIILPVARKILDAAAYGALLTSIQARLQSIGWFSLAVLALTGMFQMSANPHYEGFLAIRNNWAAAILVKHLVIFLMVAVTGYMTWVVMPTIRRNALLRAAGRSVNDAQEERLQRQEVRMLRLNLALSIIILLLTAWARSAV